MKRRSGWVRTLAAAGSIGIAVMTATSAAASSPSPSPAQDPSPVSCENFIHAQITPALTQQCLGDALAAKSTKDAELQAQLGTYFATVYAPAHTATFAGIAGQADGTIALYTTGSTGAALLGVPSALAPLIAQVRQVTYSEQTLTDMALALPAAAAPGTTYLYATVDIAANKVRVAFSGAGEATDPVVQHINTQPNPGAYELSSYNDVPQTAALPAAPAPAKLGAATTATATALTKADVLSRSTLFAPARPLPGDSGVAGDRFHDVNPWGGGDPIHFKVTTTGTPLYAPCSAGIPVVQIATNAKFETTAYHCLKNHTETKVWYFGEADFDPSSTKAPINDNFGGDLGYRQPTYDTAQFPSDVSPCIWTGKGAMSASDSTLPFVCLNGETLYPIQNKDLVCNSGYQTGARCAYLYRGDIIGSLTFNNADGTTLTFQGLQTYTPLATDHNVIAGDSGGAVFGATQTSVTTAYGTVTGQVGGAQPLMYAAPLRRHENPLNRSTPCYRILTVSTVPSPAVATPCS